MDKASLRRLAPKMEYGYFLLQPSSPPCEVMVVRAASVLITLARPALNPSFSLDRLVFGKSFA